MNEENILKLHANCIPVRGARRSIICDLHYNSYKFIPNTLYDILTDYKEKSLREIKGVFDNRYDNEIADYFLFLIKEDLGFECTKGQFSQYPELEMRWEIHAQVTNSIIDLNEFSRYNLYKVANELSELRCMAVQIRFFSAFSLMYIAETLSCFNSTRIQSLELIIRQDTSFDDEDLKELCANFPRISLITIYASPSNREYDVNPLGVTMHFIQEVIESSSHCGFINASMFNVNQQMFLEAKNYNSCLNKKISIDVSGEIKNCPSFERSYGNIQDTSLRDALDFPDFKSAWNVTKDNVDICSVCEFRYICTDCRAYTQNGSLGQGKPLKCTYDPYNAIWA